MGISKRKRGAGRGFAQAKRRQAERLSVVAAEAASSGDINPNYTVTPAQKPADSLAHYALPPGTDEKVNRPYLQGIAGAIKSARDLVEPVASTAAASYLGASRAPIGRTYGPEYLMPLAEGVRAMGEIPASGRTVYGVPADILKMERLQELIGQAPAHERAGLERRFGNIGETAARHAAVPFPPGSKEHTIAHGLIDALAPFPPEVQQELLRGAQAGKAFAEVRDKITQKWGEYNEAQLRRAFLGRIEKHLEDDLDVVAMEKRALDDMRRLEKEPRLERIAATQYHDLRENRGAILSPLTDKAAMRLDFVDHGLLVVEHDWSAAFANAGGDDFARHEVRLPYECTVLEMRVCGMHVCAHVLNHTIDDKLAIFCRNKDGWFFFGALEFEASTGDWLFMEPNENGKALQDASRQRGGAFDGRIASTFGAWIARQARSIAVALDAEVATREIVRAAYKLNRERERRGKLPIYDYHVVRLAHRLGRTAPVPPEFRGALDPDRPITRRRLHFRRGHWRHFPSHKTWIRWMLCGDPALGFIDKEYRI